MRRIIEGQGSRTGVKLECRQGIASRLDRLDDERVLRRLAIRRAVDERREERARGGHLVEEDERLSSGGSDPLIAS